MGYPKRRELGLLRQPLDEELLLFDSERNRAHSLNATAASVWQACDGQRSHEELAAECGIDEATLGLALERLRGAHLLEEVEVLQVGISRRRMIRRSLATGAALGIAVPVIRSITAPSPAMAATNGRVKGKAGEPCTKTSQCSSPESFCQGSGLNSCQRGHFVSCSHTSSCLHNNSQTYACIGNVCNNCTATSQCPGGYTCSGGICKT